MFVFIHKSSAQFKNSPFDAGLPRLRRLAQQCEFRAQSCPGAACKENDDVKLRHTVTRGGARSSRHQRKSQGQKKKGKKNVFEFKCFLTRRCSRVIKAPAPRHFPQRRCPGTCSLSLVPLSESNTTAREIMIM